MRIITNSGLTGKRPANPVVTIGIFDGIHEGHKKLLSKVAQKARRAKGTGLVITFDPHPNRILDMIGAPPLLVSLKHRLKLIEAQGIDAALVLNFNKTLARYTALEFVKKILVKKIGARAVVIGSDFRFGKNKKGDIGLLKAMGRQYGFTVQSVPLLKIGGIPVSSTRIRALVLSGRLKEASILLGRPVSVLGTVINGSRRGRILGYPTANINPHHEAIPPSGVYAVYALVNGKKHKGILNIGVRPTFHNKGESEPTIEAHLFGFNKDIYGKDIEIIFIRRLRAEKRFPNREALIKQIRIDEQTANVIL
ncbi:MAG: riboflavin biosynthesis protein RibF [Candidatus Omnitrophica bacterium]|nr:riboflavin biosynthesis protein RibF [Candidatus Omnitrophota bacterium]